MTKHTEKSNSVTTTLPPSERGWGWVSETKDYVFISVGVILYALGVTVFMLPYNLTTGGVAGIASIVYYATGLEVQVTYIGINVCLLIAAIKVLGIRFCMKTIYAVLLMTLTLWLLQRLIEVPDAMNAGKMVLPQLIGEESFMACVLGAIMCGIGLAFCFENNGSTGGTDIIAAIVNKYKQMSLGTVIMACDVIIISSCYFIFHDWYRVIYGFVMLFICSMTLDYCIRHQHQSVQFMIFSRNYNKLADAINETGHGVTILDGEGWYTKSERKVIISIVRKRDSNIIFRMIKRIDPFAFVSMSEAQGVYGEAFDALKVSAGKDFKNKSILVYATNDPNKIKDMQELLGEAFDVRSLQDIGCDETFSIKNSTTTRNAVEKGKYVKRYFGFDVIAQGPVSDNNDEVSFVLVQGAYDAKEYTISTFHFATQLKDFLVK